MKLLYIENIRIPTQKAHGIQIIKTCEALALQGCQVELILPTRENSIFKGINPFQYYGVKKIFKIKKIISIDPFWLMKLPQGIYIKFQTFYFQLSLFFYLLFKKDKAHYIFYTRQ